MASGRALAAELTALGFPATSGHEVGELLRAGNADAARLAQRAGRHIGEVMATVVCLLNPEVVLIGGALASAPLLAGIRETLYRSALPRATRHLQLQLGTLGENAAVVGLTRLVVDHEFAAAAGEPPASHLSRRRTRPAQAPCSPSGGNFSSACS